MINTCSDDSNVVRGKVAIPRIQQPFDVDMQRSDVSIGVSLHNKNSNSSRTNNADDSNPNKCRVASPRYQQPSNTDIQHVQRSCNSGSTTNLHR